MQISYIRLLHFFSSHMGQSAYAAYRGGLLLFTMHDCLLHCTKG